LLDNDANAILLDVRTEEEFKEVHLEGAILIPYDEIIERAISEISDKNTSILVYCLSGGRSETAARALIELGYTNVYDLGGLIDLFGDDAGALGE
jgi:rhodanese-related sulfurtransferase